MTTPPASAPGSESTAVVVDLFGDPAPEPASVVKPTRAAKPARRRPKLIGDTSSACRECNPGDTTARYPACFVCAPGAVPTEIALG